MQKLIEVKQGTRTNISTGRISIDELHSRLNALKANGYTHIDISIDRYDEIYIYPLGMRKETYQEWKDRIYKEKELEKQEILEFLKQRKIRNSGYINCYEIDGYKCNEMCLCEHSSNFPHKCNGCDHLKKI